ncbi:hypothetical protein D3C74_480330 [compost metagenome]
MDIADFASLNSQSQNRAHVIAMFQGQKLLFSGGNGEYLQLHIFGIKVPVIGSHQGALPFCFRRSAFPPYRNIRVAVN